MKLCAAVILALFPSSAMAFAPSFGRRISVSSLFSETPTITTRPDGSYSLDGEEIRGPITPMGNFVLVRTKDALSASVGGILLPDSSKERPTEGEVVAHGPGKLHPHTGVRITCPVTIGQSVLYGEYDGTALKYNDEDMQMIRDDDIMLYYSGRSIKLETATPCRDYVLVKIEKDNLETESGIVVAASATKDLEDCQGIVVKVGEGRMCSTGEFTPSPVSVGDEVKYRDYAGSDVKIEGENYQCVRMVDILSVVPLTDA